MGAPSTLDAGIIRHIYTNPVHVGKNNLQVRAAAPEIEFAMQASWLALRCCWHRSGKVEVAGGACKCGGVLSYIQIQLHIGIGIGAGRDS